MTPAPSWMRLSIWAIALAGALVARADVPPYEYPPPPPAQTFEPIEPNPYFVQDPADPRILHPAPGFFERGIDRGYIERMVRGDIPPEVFDELKAAGAPEPGPVPNPVELQPPPGVHFAVVQSGNVLVVEGDTQLVVDTEGGPSFNHNGAGLQRAVSAVWTYLGDNYDFITVFTTFDDPSVAAYYLPLRQDVTGLGDCNFNSGETFGCVFNQLGPGATLQGFVFMNSLNYWRAWDYNYDGLVHPYDDLDASVYAVLGQEIGHRWGAGLRFVDPRTGSVSKKLLGRDNSHWAAYVDSDASVMDGWDWAPPDESGQFQLVDDMRRFSLLDLYAMGAVPVASPEPFFFIDNARFVPIPSLGLGNQPVPEDAALQIPSVSFLAANGITLKATGEKVDLTIQDVVNVEGVRCPDKDHTQKAFRQAVVLVTRPGETAAQVQSAVQNLETVMVHWEEWWRDRTRKALTLCTDVVGECVHPEASLGPGELSYKGDAIEPGSDFELVLSALAENDTVENARARVQVFGNGAKHTELEASTFEIGDIPAGGSREIRIPLSLSEDYVCGYSIIVRVELESDNAETVWEEYRVFPGYREVYAATFDEGEDGFTVNADGLDETSSGAFEWTEVTLTCTMGPRTPERDASPGGKGAFITANDGELFGTSSLWSGEIELEGTVAPELRFAYWLDGREGDGRLKVLLSRTGKGFTEVKTYEKPFHGWSLGRIVIHEVYEEVPEKVQVVFIFEGDGQVEGGIDEVRVIDPVGTCQELLAPAMCACAASGDAEGDQPARLMGVFAALLLGLLVGRRRKKRV